MNERKIRLCKVLGHLLFSTNFQCCMHKNIIKRDSVLEKFQRENHAHITDEKFAPLPCQNLSVQFKR